MIINSFWLIIDTLNCEGNVNQCLFAFGGLLVCVVLFLVVLIGIYSAADALLLMLCCCAVDTGVGEEPAAQ